MSHKYTPFALSLSKGESPAIGMAVGMAVHGFLRQAQDRLAHRERIG